jgi:hypothetical protein
MLRHFGLHLLVLASLSMIPVTAEASRQGTKVSKPHRVDTAKKRKVVIKKARPRQDPPVTLTRLAQAEEPVILDVVVYRTRVLH